MKDIHNYEIMAPVGSYESLATAIRAGANAVYFGVEGLNMRTNSSNNFIISDLYKIAKICEKHHIRSYLTVNTIIYNSDIEKMQTIIEAAQKAKLSAIIASDIAVMMYARSVGIEVHLSTQLNITNIESIQFYAQFADVVVLARELNLEQVKEIHDQIVERQIKGPSGKLIRIEIFCHGALCMAVSGKCYLSLHEMNSSANRGACNQVCRRSYLVKDKESEIELEVGNPYIMSPKDLKTIHFLNKILDAGVQVIKIEGRARGPEYVKIVTECYKEALHSYCDDSFSEEKIKDWDKRLERVFNRGFWNGYYLGQRLGEWSNKYGNKAIEKKMYIGKAVKYFSKLNVAEFLMETQSLKVGDKILITGPTTGALFSEVKEIRVNLIVVEQTKKGEYFSLKTPAKVRPSDKLYKLIQNPDTLVG
ncbi:MAG: U32 family peptidase [Dysgonamonadaceae bacterium]|jgi:putative protease|nr:U32 family peptidase [Dysgonamonadaceae bacterium]